MNSGKPQDVIVRNRRVAIVKELANEWIAALPPGRNSGSLTHREDTKLRTKLSRKLRLHALDSSGEVPDPEEAMCVYGSTIVNVFPAHMRQARCREIDSRTGHHAVLDRNVFEMMILNLGCGFNFDQSPALVFATMQHIDAHENTAVLERTFEDRRNFPVRN